MYRQRVGIYWPRPTKSSEPDLSDETGNLYKERKMLMLNAHACLAFFRNGDYFLSLHSQLTSACKIRALRNLFVSVGNPRKGCESKSYYQNPKIRSVRQTVANDVINGRSCFNRKQAKTVIKRELWYEEPKYITRRIETDKCFIIHTTSI